MKSVEFLEWNSSCRFFYVHRFIYHLTFANLVFMRISLHSNVISYSYLVDNSSEQNEFETQKKRLGFSRFGRDHFENINFLKCTKKTNWILNSREFRGQKTSLWYFSTRKMTQLSVDLPRKHLCTCTDILCIYLIFEESLFIQGNILSIRQ